MKRKIVCLLAGILVFTLIIPVIASAQASGTGALQGHVIDRYGNPIVGANVTLNSGFFNDPKPWTITDAGGMYLFSNIDLTNSNIWRVTVVVEYPGYPDLQSRSEYKNVHDGQLVTIDMQFLSYPPSGLGSLYGVLTSSSELSSPWYEGVVFITPLDYPGVTLFTYVDTFPNGDPAYFSMDYLPVGEYTVRGQHNTLNNQTLYSETITGITVSEDKNSFLQVYVPYSPISPTGYPQPSVNSVRGYITGEDGVTPITNVNVTLQRATSATFYTQVAMVYTDENGYYNMSGIHVDGIRATFRIQMSYQLGDQDYGWISPDFYIYNENSYGENANHNQVFARSLNVNLTGYVEFDSNPQNASIYINDIYRGMTPDTISLAEGTYNYVLTLDSYANYTGTFIVNRHETTVLNASLVVVTPTLTPPVTTTPGDNTTMLTMGIVLVIIIVIAVGIVLVVRLRKRRMWQSYPGHYQQPPGGYYQGGGPGGYYGPPSLPPYDPYQGYQGYERGHYNVEPYGQQPPGGQPVQGYLPPGQETQPGQYPPGQLDAYMGQAERRPSYQMRESQPTTAMGQGFTPEEQDYVLRYISQNPGGVSFVQMSRDLDIPMNVLTLITKELVINGLVEKDKGNYYPKMQGDAVDSSSVMVWRDD